MIKKYGIGVLAVLVAGMAVAFTTPKMASGPNVNYNYAFNGAHGQEGTTSKWDLIASPSEKTCPVGNDQGCRIVSTSNVGGHPASVPVNSFSVPILQAPTTSLTNQAN